MNSIAQAFSPRTTNVFHPGLYIFIYEYIHALAAEMYKVVNGMSPEIINEVFKQRNCLYYNLRKTTQFSANPVHNVYYGIQSVLHLGQRFGSKYFSQFEMGNPLKIFSGKSRNENQLTTLVEVLIPNLEFI